jgi:heme-degrading monooxygenase HmoA
LLPVIHGMHLISRRVARSIVDHRIRRLAAMIVTVFRSRLRPGLREEYVAMVDQMAAIAATMPGYISHKGFFADDGERVTVVEFETMDATRAWRMHPEHRVAQKLAKERYYEGYSVQVCEVIRESRFARDEAS